MKISVITVCRNSETTLESTMLSVLGQDHPDIEYIIVDGASTDGTLAIIDKYRDKLARIISEKDSGIYFALNKGLKLAGGDLIAFLHSDDFYPHPKVLSAVCNAMQKNGTHSVYGDLQYVAREDSNKVIRNWKAGPYTDGLFLKGWMPPHPAFFLERNCYERYGAFNTSLVSAADYELMLRMLHKQKVSTCYLPEVLVKMRQGGMSNLSLRNRLRANREDRLAWELNGLKPGPFTLIRKPLSKLAQFLR